MGASGCYLSINLQCLKTTPVCGVEMVSLHLVMDVIVVCQKHVALLRLFFPPSIGEKVKVLKTSCFTHREVHGSGAPRLGLRPIALAKKKKKKKLQMVTGSFFPEKIMPSIEKSALDLVVK